MNPARAKAQRLEKKIELLDLSATDERERACQLVFDGAKGRNKTFRRHDVARTRRQIEQRAVDVEKECDWRVAQRRHILHRRARMGGALN